MTARPPAIGSLLPALADGPPAEGSVWETWTAGYAHACAFRTARGALAAVLRQDGGARVWLPAYVCDALLATVDASGAEPCWYDPGANLRLDRTALTDVADGDAVVVIDPFGRSPPPEIAALAASRPGVLWIEDRAQALAPDAPAFGAVVLYSPRKLFGVGDGGLVVSNVPLPFPTAAEDDRDWAPNDARALDLDGAAPDRWFPAFQAREAGFAVDDAPMSRRTRAALAATPLETEAQARRANWRVLAERLAHLALWPEREVSFAPLAFPILVDDAGALAARLADERIWCARHWATLPSPADLFPEAHALARRCLSLPLDGHHGAAEMERVAEAVLRLQPR